MNLLNKYYTTILSTLFLKSITLFLGNFNFNILGSSLFLMIISDNWLFFEEQY